MLRYLAALLWLVPALALADQPAETTADSMLAEPAWLATQIMVEAIESKDQPRGQDEREAQTLLLLDVCADKAKRVAKPPGAIAIDAAEWKQAFGDGTDAAGWSARIGGVLKNKNATVVVFDQQFSPTAARIWWILKYWGVQDVRVLDGGFQGYLDANGVIVTGDRGPNNAPSNFEAQPHPERLATYDRVRAIAGDTAGGVCLVDTRTDQENSAGRVLTSKHLDWQELVDPETGRLRAIDQLAALLDRVGFDPQRPTVTYCRSGGRASVMAFAMELVGGKPVANYHGSFIDWTQHADAPIEQPSTSAIGQ